MLICMLNTNWVVKLSEDNKFRLLLRADGRISNPTVVVEWMAIETEALEEERQRRRRNR